MKNNITNIFGENLDVLIEGNLESSEVIVFVHGFGTDKNEGFATFLELADFLENEFITIRFDLSGYGESEGEDYEFQFQKAAGDVESVIRYARKEFEGRNVSIIAHSLGTYITGILSPHEIDKTVFTSVPNANVDFVIEQLKKRIISKGGVIDEEGLTVYPRSSGVTQKIGKDFWRTLRTFNPVESFDELGAKTKLLILKPENDDVLENKYFDEYKEIESLEYFEIPGNHNFTNLEDRKNLFMRVRSFLLEGESKRK